MPASNVCVAQTPSVAYDNQNNKYLAVYTTDTLTGSPDIVGRLIFETGGKDMDINSIAVQPGVNVANPSVAYNNTNRKYLVVWENTSGADSSIEGKFVTAGGNVESLITVSNGSVNPARPYAAYDNVNNKFLVIWQDNRDGNFNIYGQLYNAANQTAIGSNFLISNVPDTNNRTSAALAYSTQYDIETQADIDKALKVFLIVWKTYDGSTYSIKGQLYDADQKILVGPVLSVSDSSTVDQDARPSVAYTVSNDIDTTNHDFIIAWQDTRNGDNDIYGQIYNAFSETLINTNFMISDVAATGDQLNPAVSYDYVNSPPKFLAVWDNGVDIYGQYINNAGVLSGSNFTVSEETYPEHSSALSFSDNCKNFLAVFTKSDTTTEVIAAAVVGPCKTSGGGGDSGGGGGSSAGSGGSAAGGGGCFIDTAASDPGWRQRQ